MPELIAKVSLTLEGWTGWSREQPRPESIAIEARRMQVLGPADFGIGSSEIEPFSRWQIRLMTLLQDRAIFEYQRLVLPNPSGTVNLSAPATGTFLLHPGQHLELATPTMDAGLLLTVALQAIKEMSGAADN